MKKPGDLKRRVSPRLRDDHCLLILLVLTLVFFRKALFPGVPVILGSPVLVDLTHQFYPWRLFGFGLLKKGMIPLWNPYLFCGQPFIAAMQSAIFYPPNLIFLLLPARVAVNWSFALHVFLAGTFVYAYMRYIIGDRVASLVSAISFMLSAPVILRIFSGHLSVVCSLPWFPLQLLAVEAGVRTRRPRFFVLCGAACTAQLLAGQPQYLFYSILAVLIYLACRCVPLLREEGARKILPAAAVAVVIALGTAAGLGAVQLLPGIEYIPHSVRAVMSFEEAAGGSFPPGNFATLLLPEVYGDFISGFFWGNAYLWEVSLYVGILPVFLALLALFRGRDRYVRIFVILAAASMLLALGSHTPLFRFLYDWAPPFRLFRGTNKALFVAAYCLCFLAGIGCRVLLGKNGRVERTLRGRVITVLVVAGGASALCAAVAFIPWARELFLRTLFEICPPRFRGPSDMGAVTRIEMRGICRLLIFLAATTALLGLSLWKANPRGLMGLLAVGIIVGDLWSFGSRYMLTSLESSCWWPRDVAELLKEDRDLNRYLRDGSVRVPGVNQGMNDRLYGYQGYDPHNLGRYWDFVNRLGVREQEVGRLLLEPRQIKLASMANLKYLIIPSRLRLWHPWYRLRFDNGHVKVLENTRVLPRARVVHGATVVREPLRALEVLWAGKFDTESSVLLEEEPRLPLSGRAEASEVKVESYEACRVELRVSLDEPGILVLSDVWYPGWEATVDGRSAEILRANYLFRAVEIGSGEHEVVFSYSPLSFRYGALISLVSLVIIGALLIPRRKIRVRPNL